MKSNWIDMRLRLASFLLFLIPLTTLLGETPLLKAGSLPVYWFEAATLFFTALMWPEIKTGGLGRLKQVPKLLSAGALLLLPALLIAVSFAANKHDAAGAALAWFIAPGLLATVIVASGVSLLPLVYGVVANAIAQTIFGFIILPGQEETRLLGTFDSANFYAAVAAPALFVTLLLPSQWKVWRWGIVALLLLGLFQSQSLGGFLGVIGAAVFVGVQSVKEVGLRRIIGIGVAIVALAGGVVVYQRYVVNQGSSLASRGQIWQVAERVIEEHPVTGVGLRNFKAAYEAKVLQVVKDPIEASVPEPHNLYLAFWLDLSLLGLVAMLLLIIGVVELRSVAAAPIVAILVHGLVDTPIFKLELAVLFWLYIALAVFWRGRKAGDLLA